MSPRVKRSATFSWLTILMSVGLLLSGCHSTPPPADWQTWRTQRHTSVAGTNGWSTLIGLFWLEEGANTVGTNPTLRAVLPTGRAPALLGTFTRTGREVQFQAAPQVEAFIDGHRVDTAALLSDADGTRKPTRLTVGEMTLTVIERGPRLGLRVRDPQAPTRVHFGGLEYFPYQPAWRIEGRFEPVAGDRQLRVPDVTGGVQTLPSPGDLVFTVRGTEYRLQATLEPDEPRFFIIFRDTTAGDSTYPAGRFLYVDPPDATGHVVLDFNRAYSPPCAFTPFATCPLPPPANRLPFPIRAGERTPPGH